MMWQFPQKNEELKELMKKLERGEDVKKLTLNVEKTKIVEFSKARGREKKDHWIWKNRETVNFLKISVHKTCTRRSKNDKKNNRSHMEYRTKIFYQIRFKIITKYYYSTN